MRFSSLLTALVAMAACTSGVQNPVGDERPPPVPECSIVADDALTVEELPLVPGISARYVRNLPGTQVVFNIDGTESDGIRTWDFSEGPADVGATFVTLDPAEQWFSAVFPEADLAAPMLVESPELLGVYAVDEAAGELLLLGVTTATEVPPEQQTRIIYDEPVVALRLPLLEGQTWGQQATFRDAVIAGIPNSGVEDFLFTVDASGTARLEAGIEVEQVLRVRSSVTRTLTVSLGDPTSQLHKAVWMAPCFGDLASVTSTGADLDPAEELRRYFP